MSGVPGFNLLEGVGGALSVSEILSTSILVASQTLSDITEPKTDYLKVISMREKASVDFIYTEKNECTITLSFTLRCLPE